MNQSNRTLAATFELAAVGIAQLTPDGRWMRVNHKLCEIVGYTESELLDLTFQDITFPEDLESDLSLANAILEGRISSYAMEKRYVRKDRSLVWVNLSVSLVRDQKGDPDFFISVVEDIHARKTAEEELKRWKHAFQNASWGMTLATPDNRFISVNEAFAKMHGGTADAWSGRNLLDMFAEESKPLLPKLAEVVHEKGSVTYESMHIREDGSVFPVLTEVTAFKDHHGKVLFRAANFQDITARKRAEEELVRSRSQLEASFQALQDGVCVFDPEGNLVLANDALPRIAGYESIEAYQIDLKHFAEKFEVWNQQGELVPLESWPASRVLRGETVVNCALHSRRRDTEQEWDFVFSGEPVRDETGKQILSVVVVRDVTELKRAEGEYRFQSELTRSIADNAASCLFMIDEKGHPTYMNPAAMQVTGFDSLDEIKDRPLHQSMHWKRPDGSSYPSCECPIDRAYSQFIGIKDQEEIFCRKDGSFFPVSFSVAPLKKGGKFVGSVLEFRDITDQKMAERELLEAIRSRDEFLSIASHELKTPLTSLLLQAQSVKRGVIKDPEATLTSERVLKLTGQIEKQVSRLSRLVDDMLDIARIRAGKLSLEPQEFDFCELVKDVSDRLSYQLTQAGGAGPEIVLCEPIYGRWDQMRMEQVVINLLTNAVRYGNGEPIQLKVEKHSDRLRFVVKDHGIGIAPRDHQRIFNRFERAISANEVSGLGLGLFIVRQIVDGHGGKIWVESELGEGATFYVELPVAAPPSISPLANF